MPAFRASGSTGQAPTTAFFGRLPDRLNMLTPQEIHNEAASGGRIAFANSFLAANFLNQMTIFNLSMNGGANTNTVSFGGFIPAPDGTTNTMQFMTEAVTNSQHMVIGGGGSIGIIRFAGFFKSSNRRIVLELATAFEAGQSGYSPSGCRACFDLVNGQIGVAATPFDIAVPNTTLPYTAIGQGIIPFGNGIYLCYMDCFAQPGNTLSGGIMGRAIIDNGTGTNAISTTYVGDGASGVYGWRINVMPVAAYAISGQTFFDGFDDNTMSKFDLTNSKAPGFTWYLYDKWPSPDYPGGVGFPSDPTKLHVSGSVLTIDSAIHSNLLTAAWTGTGTNFVGGGFKWPFLVESRFNYDYTKPANTTGSGDIAFWSTTIEGLLSSLAAANKYSVANEIDWIESANGGAQGELPGMATHGQGGLGGFGPNQTTETIGIPPFISPTYIQGTGHNNGINVDYLGLFYHQLNDDFVNPPLANANFEPYSTFNTHITPILFDPGQYHTWSWLHLTPPSHGLDRGGILAFIDGTFVNGVSLTFTASDQRIPIAAVNAPLGTWPIILAAGNVVQFQLQYVSVEQ
jgi:hypothetical protein